MPKSQRKTEDILELIGLTDKAEAYARSLSGGMRRRLLLGKALVHSPQILVLDEPTAGVDIQLRNMLWANVRRLNEQGMTIILTTHYLEEAQEMCDEIGIIDNGQLIARDTTANLIGRMDQKTLVITPEGDAPTAVPLPDGITHTIGHDGTHAFTYSQSTITTGHLIEAIRAAGMNIRDIRTQEPDLEDAFLALTAKHPAS